MLVEYADERAADVQPMGRLPHAAQPGLQGGRAVALCQSRHRRGRERQRAPPLIIRKVAGHVKSLLRQIVADSSINTSENNCNRLCEMS